MQVIGAIQLVNTRYGRAFTDHDCDIVQGLQPFLQIAIVNHKVRTELCTVPVTTVWHNANLGV